MVFYEMFQGYTPIAPDLSVWMETDPRYDLYLPRVYCDTCHRGGELNLFREYPIPFPVPMDHPVVRELRQLHRRYRKINAALNAEMRELMNQYWARGESIPEGHPIFRRISQGGAISPEEFRELAARVREALNVPTEWTLVPGARVGPFPLRYYYSPLPDLGWTDAGRSLIVRERAVQVFREAGLTGWSVYPVGSATYRGRLPAGPPPPLYEFLITGKAGAPRGVDPDDYDLCERCGALIRVGVPKRIEVEPDRWDGSDFFQFDFDSKRYVSERAREVMEAADMEEVGFRDPNEPQMTTEERAAFLRKCGIVEREIP